MSRISKSCWISWISESKKKKLTFTLNETLVLFDLKKSIEEISKVRNMKIESVEKQIIELISKGFIFILDIIDLEKFDLINNFIDENSIYSISKLKNKFEDNFSYFEIKCVLAHISLIPSKNI